MPGCVSSWRGSSQRTCPPSSPSAPAKVNRLLSDQSHQSTFRPKSTVDFQTEANSPPSSQSAPATGHPKSTIYFHQSQLSTFRTKSTVHFQTKVNCLLSDRSQQSTFRYNIPADAQSSVSPPSCPPAPAAAKPSLDNAQGSSKLFEKLASCFSERAYFLFPSHWTTRFLPDPLWVHNLHPKSGTPNP